MLDFLGTKFKTNHFEKIKRQNQSCCKNQRSSSSKNQKIKVQESEKIKSVFNDQKDELLRSSNQLVDKTFFFVFTNCIWKTFHLRLKILHLKQNTFCNFEVRQNNLGKAGKKAMEKRLSFIRTYASSKTGSFPLST